MRSSVVKRLAAESGFDLAGITPAVPTTDAAVLFEWIAAGMAGEMGYLTDYRAGRRSEPRTLLPSAKSIIRVAKSYNQRRNEPNGGISSYASGADYHDTLKRDLADLVARMRAEWGDFEYKACVDTAPILERSYARLAGLGWIGKNTCLINQQQGSFLFLGEVLVSLDLEPDTAAPYRCGTCTRCIDACPTAAIVPGGHATLVDSRRCISYLTIELRGPIPEDLRPETGAHVFGCDICQEVCPWNSKTTIAADAIANGAPADLEVFANMSPDGFRAAFRHTPVWRTRYSGFLRNVAVAMGNSGDPRYRPMLETLAGSPDALVAEHAQWALSRLAHPA